MPTLPPGPRRPRLLQLLAFLRDAPGFLEGAARRFGDVFTVRFPSFPGQPANPPMVFVSDPDRVRTVFTGDDDALRAGEANVDLRPLLGEHSLLLLDGARHLRERRLMQPPFHGERLLSWGRTMQAVAVCAIDGWAPGATVRMYPAMQQVTLEVIMRTVFGLADGPRLDALRTMLPRLLALGLNPLAMLVRAELGGVTPWGRFRRLQREVDALLLAEIRERRTSSGRGDDVLSMLLDARDDAGAPMTDEELRDEMMTLLLAGHETTATALAWAVARVIGHPEVAARLRAEIGGAAAEDPAPDPNRTARLPYLDAFAKETLRLNAVVPLVGRWLHAPLVLGDRALPPGVVVVPCIHLAHRRAATWGDPEVFRPERFLGVTPSPYTFFPFGGGTRRCLGMAFAMHEMKLVLAELVSRCELTAVPGHRVRPVSRAVTIVPSEGMPVVVRPRDRPPVATAA